MDEYLFFQKNKKYLKDNNSILSEKIFPAAKSSVINKDPFMRISQQGKFKEEDEHPLFTAPKQKGPKPDPITGKLVYPPYPPERELNSDTMQGCFQKLSNKYKDQYTSSGFPPKICTLIMRELINTNKQKVQILDLGCGKGYVGEYLKPDGFLHISGVDCSKNLLQAAKETKCYEHLEKHVFGQGDELDESYFDKYDVVISASMINNDGWEKEIFLQMMKYVKMGGFIIFSTKLTLKQENQYQDEMENLSNEQYWKFVTDHTFYRYDKLGGNKGKFSNKLVKVFAYQKTDHEEYFLAQKDRLEAEAIEQEKREKEIERRIKEKDYKLNAAKYKRIERLARIKACVKAREDKEQAEIDAIKAEEERIVQEALLDKERKARMMLRLKTFLKNTMWIKLKAIQQKAEEELQVKRQESDKKRKQAILARQQTMMVLKKVPYDSEEEPETLRCKTADGILKDEMDQITLMNQNLPA